MKNIVLLIFLFVSFNIMSEELIEPKPDQEEGIVADSDRPNLYDRMRISRRWKSKRQKSTRQRRPCKHCMKKH